MISESAGIKPRSLHISHPRSKQRRVASTRRLDRTIQIPEPLTNVRRRIPDTPHARSMAEKRGFSFSRRNAPEIWRSEGRMAPCTRAPAQNESREARRPQLQWIVISAARLCGLSNRARKSRPAILIARAALSRLRRILHPTPVTIAIRPCRVPDARRLRVICPTAQASGMRCIGTTGESLSVSRLAGPMTNRLREN
jgi:hypothetical protein